MYSVCAAVADFPLASVDDDGDDDVCVSHVEA